VNTKNQINNANFQYDASGNLTFDGSLNSTYDAENRITSTNGGVNYTYDGDGRRVKKSNGKLYWYGSGSDPLEETDLTGTPTAEYIFFGGKRTARLDLPSATVHYYFANHLGSASVVTSSTGVIQDESDFYPFGGERVLTDTDPNQYKFTGKERDTESALDYFGARYYSSQFGRFMTPDWDAAPTTVPYADFGNPQSLNLYTYVGNNPITTFDTDGHCWPIGECAAQIQNAVDRATEKVISAAANTGSPGVAFAVTALAGTGRDIVNGTVDSFRAGEAIGGCVDNCNGQQFADAIGQDLNRTAGLVDMAAGAVGTGQTLLRRGAADIPEVTIDSAKYPQTAEHVHDAQAAGQPSLVTVDRSGAAGRRAEAMQGTQPTRGLDRDEYPPAVAREGGAGASVRPINPSDNRGAGASVGAQLRDVADGEKVKIKVK
jgi:RHS repeat-associated protein